MASLISPGVSVTITDESFFIPAAAVTVPLIFIATADEKKQAPANSSSMGAQLDALGTFESNVIRTVTSRKQSVALYGIPTFIEDVAGNPYHGDVRNEYGLFALNQFLGIGNRAYVIRANVNLNDNQEDLRDMWDVKMQEASYVLENIVTSHINTYNLTNGYTPQDPSFKTTVSRTELNALASNATEFVWKLFSFTNIRDEFMDDHTAVPLDMYPNGFSQHPQGTYTGFLGMTLQWEQQQSGQSSQPMEWTADEAGNILLSAADQLKYTVEFVNATALGATDEQRRIPVIRALQAAVRDNEDIRSETYEYNLILCPGFPELADEMVSLCVDINEEAFVVCDTPFNKDPDQVVAWGDTTDRQRSRNIAYYYPHGFGSNLDGSNVMCAASGVALRTIAYSDEVAELWFAPAGTRRGMVNDVTTVGYVSGTLGSPTKFNEVALNQGQRDNMYKYFTNINPIVFFPTRGLIVWGQKTSAPDASALDRINVVRLMMYIKRQLRKNTMSFVFEPNDKLTRDNLKAVVDSFLGDLIVKRGLYDFVTVCDESNNTPDRIDRNELYVDVALKPVKAAEFIYIPIRVVNTGTTI